MSTVSFRGLLEGRPNAEQTYRGFVSSVPHTLVHTLVPPPAPPRAPAAFRSADQPRALSAAAGPGELPAGGSTDRLQAVQVHLLHGRLPEPAVDRPVAEDGGECLRHCPLCRSSLRPPTLPLCPPAPFSPRRGADQTGWVRGDAHRHRGRPVRHARSGPGQPGHSGQDAEAPPARVRCRLCGRILTPRHQPLSRRRRQLAVQARTLTQPFVERVCADTNSAIHSGLGARRLLKHTRVYTGRPLRLILPQLACRASRLQQEVAARARAARAWACRAVRTAASAALACARWRRPWVDRATAGWPSLSACAE